MGDYTKNWIKQIGNLENYDREALVELHKLAGPIAKDLKLDVGSVVAMMLWRSDKPVFGQIWPR